MIAFGPSAAMLGITIAKDPIRIIILISAYVLLISLIMSVARSVMISRLLISTRHWQDEF